MSKRLLTAILALMLCLSMVVSLASCFDSKTPDDKKDDQTQTDDGNKPDDGKPDDGKPDDGGQSGDPVGPKTETKTEYHVVNDEQTLVIQESTFDGVFNPFFYSSAYDGDVCGMVNVGLLTMDQTGAVVAGPEYDTVAESYSIYYTNDLVNYTKKDTYEEGDYVVYEIVVKNGAKFSDGSPITAEDVLFNYYVFLDPAYSGSATLYTLPILGLADYRTQVVGSATYYAKAALMLAAGDAGYEATEAYTEAEYNAYWAQIEASGKAFAQEIVNYVVTNYGNLEYAQGAAKGYGKYSGLSGIDVKVNVEKKVALGMSMWGFGSFDSISEYTEAETGTKGYLNEKYINLWTPTEDEEEAMFEDAEGTLYTSASAETASNALYRIVGGPDDDGCYEVEAYTGARYAVSTTWFDTFTDSTGKKYNMVDEFPTIDDYWAALKDGYTDEDGVDYVNLSDVESAGMDLIGAAAEGFTSAYASVGSVANIAGIIKGTADDKETVKIVLTEQNPKAILSLGVTVTPKAYYTAGYKYSEGAVVNAGVELGVGGNTSFMDYLHTLDAAPMGAGVYKFVKAEGDGVTLVRNDYHYTLGNENVYNANIKNVYLKVVTSGEEYNALKAGTVDYANPSATGDVVAEIATLENLTSILVDNLGYGYICLNPAATEYGLDNIYTRIAYTSVFDQAQVLNYYPSGLADIIYRSQSQVSWAYPEGAEAIYPYDETLATAIANFKLAGYTFDDEEGKFTDVPDMDFYLPSAANDHPAGDVFLKAQELLATIGITANINVDESLIANIKKSAVPCYALAWQSSADPDMYQVYHYASAAESVISNGIQALYKNGISADLGTIEVTKLDGSKVTMTQSQALGYLAELIEEGVKYMNVEERKPIYVKALEVLAQLSIEIPTYQRKNMFAYNNEVIDGTTLSQTVTPYWGPLAELWKVSFAAGIEGNQTVEYTYEVVVED